MARFGDETAGADTFPCSGDRALLSRFTLTEAGDLTEIVARFDAASTAGASLKGLVYSDNAGTPQTRLAVGAAVAVPAGGGLVASALTVSLAAGEYWLGFVADSFQAVAQCDAAGGLSRMEGTTYASPAATWIQAGTSAARLNVYAEYTAAATEPLLFLRKFPLQGPRAGDTIWVDESPVGALARFEFFGPADPGVPTYARSARATARPEMAASRLTTAIRSGLVRQRAEVSAARAITAARGASSKSRTEVSAARAVTNARGAIARARAEVVAARTAVLARVARAAAVTRGAVTVAAQSLTTLSRAARAAARAEVSAARAAVLARTGRAVAAARAAGARLASLLRTARPVTRARVAAGRIAALSRSATVRARALVRTGRAPILARSARVTTGARLRVLAEKIVGEPLTRPGRLFMWQPAEFDATPVVAMSPAAGVSWSDRRAVAFRPLPPERWVARG
jgi:hypothetical protein